MMTSLPMMAKLLLPIFFLVDAIDAAPDVITSYYELVESGTVTSTKYIDAPAGSATVAGLATSTVSKNQNTYVHIQLPSHDEESETSQVAAATTELAVIVTYSLCTSTSTTIDRIFATGVEYAIPPITKTIPIPLSSVVAESVSPTATQTMEPPQLGSDPTSITVGVLNPTDVDPVEFAFLSNNYQPENCLMKTAVSSVDYRNSCKNGSPTRMLSDPGMSCGEKNPCCYDCTVFFWDCPDPPCGFVHTADDYAYCADGVTYYSGGETGVDNRYSSAAPTVTAGDWTDEQKADDKDFRKSHNQPTAEADSSAAGRVVWVGEGAFSIFWRAGMLMISAIVLGV